MIAKTDSIKGQSMVTMSYTASGILANLVGGVLLDAVGVKQVLLIGIFISIIGVGIVFLALNGKKEVI